MAKFELYKDNRNEYRWRFRANNSRIVADSAEGYVNKSGAQNGIDIVKREASTAMVDDQTVAAASRYAYR